MKWENKVNHLCFLRDQRTWISALIPLLPLPIVLGFLGFGSFSLIFVTSATLILSATYSLTFSKPKPENKDLQIRPDPKTPCPNSENKATTERELADDPQTLDNSADSLSSDSDCFEFSDEESLIEIALPSGHFVGRNDGEKTRSDFFPCMFKQRSLMGLLAEINDINNEEDNLIEIDISMGSIKCSRFEVEA